MQYAEPPPKRQAIFGEEEGDEEAQEPAEPATRLPQHAAEEPPERLEEAEETAAGLETADDRAFIDDAEVEPEERYGSEADGEGEPYQHEEAQEVVEDELDAIFSKGKRKKVVR